MNIIIVDRVCEMTERELKKLTLGGIPQYRKTRFAIASVIYSATDLDKETFDSVIKNVFDKLSPKVTYNPKSDRYYYQYFQLLAFTDTHRPLFSRTRTPIKKGIRSKRFKDECRKSIEDSKRAI